MMHWAGRYNFKWTILFLFIVATCLIIRFFRSKIALEKLTSMQWRSLLIKNGSLVRKVIKSILFFIGFLFLMLALLQPQWDKKDEKIEQTGRDILIAVDISRSMLGQDVKPNRLEFAKEKIKKLLFNLSCERVGLILFSGDSVLQCPLTKDFATFFMFLNDLDVETISSGTTTIEGAIAQALKVFANEQDKKTKILCIFTDGEDFSTNLTGVKEKAAQEHLSIFTFGLGTKHGAPIPVFDHQGKQVGFEKDATGKIIMSKLNEGILKNLAEQTGAAYIKLQPLTHDDIAEFIKRIAKFEKDMLEDAHVARFQEQYPYFVLVSLICFAVEWLL
jgi:Ca-activated chloride channel family protein